MGFYHIWSWRPSWSCDPDAVNKISFPLPKEAPHKIWLWSVKGFQRRRSLSIVDDDGRMPDHEYPISLPMSLRLRCVVARVEIYVCEDKPTDRHSDIHSDS